MSTPGAIAVYTAGAGTPERLVDRPWRGVYHHWDGHPSGLGEHLIERVRVARGDVGAVVRELIDEAPWGWSSCIGQRRELLGGSSSPDGSSPPQDGTTRYTKDDPGLPVSPEDHGAAGFVYIFDVEERRLDVFLTTPEQQSERLESIDFSPTGDPDPPAFELVPEEQVVEQWLPGPKLTAEQLQEQLEGLPPLETPSALLQWVETSELDDGSLELLFRVLELNDGEVWGVVERGWDLVPPGARREPERVRNFLAALVEVLAEDPRRLDPFWLASLDPLRRSGARQRATFAAQLRALASRDLV